MYYKEHGGKKGYARVCEIEWNPNTKGKRIKEY